MVALITQDKHFFGVYWYISWGCQSSRLLVAFSASAALLSKENTSRHSRGISVVDGCGHNLECLILVSLDCQGSCARALPSLEGNMKLPTTGSLLYYFYLVRQTCQKMLYFSCVSQNVKLFHLTSAQFLRLSAGTTRNSSWTFSGGLRRSWEREQGCDRH